MTTATCHKPFHLALLDEIGYRILKSIYPGGDSAVDYSRDSASKLELFFGESVYADHVLGKDIIDYGFGCGMQSVEMALRGARSVTGIDIVDWKVKRASSLAKSEGVSDRCVFTTDYRGRADVIVSVDAFEHFESPEVVLQKMCEMLKPDGYVLASFGPLWLHPNGGHLFSVFPWAHLIFSEAALIRWRSDFKTDSATRFHEVEGGLNRMTIRRFERIVAEGPFKFEWVHLKPIRVARLFHNRLTREMLTSVVQCKLVKKDSGRDLR